MSSTSWRKEKKGGGKREEGGEPQSYSKSTREKGEGEGEKGKVLRLLPESDLGKGANAMVFRPYGEKKSWSPASLSVGGEKKRKKRGESGRGQKKKTDRRNFITGGAKKSEG